MIVADDELARAPRRVVQLDHQSDPVARALISGCRGVVDLEIKVEMAALVVDLKPGDEVIMPSFTFVSTVKVLCLEDGVDLLVTGSLAGECEGAVLPHLRRGPQKGPQRGAGE